MKKYILIIIFSFLLFPFSVKAEESRIDVTIENCSNTTSFWFNINGEVKRVGMLGFSTDDTELNKDILEYICNRFNNAELIQIEYDSENKEEDKYNRDLVWIYVDGTLLQDELIKLGYGKVDNIKGNYSYLYDLCNNEKEAIKNNLGIWSKGAKDDFCSKNEEELTISFLETQSANVSKFNKSTLKSLVAVNSILLLLVLLLRWSYKYEKE